MILIYTRRLGQDMAEPIPPRICLRRELAAAHVTASGQTLSVLFVLGIYACRCVIFGHAQRLLHCTTRPVLHAPACRYRYAGERPCQYQLAVAQQDTEVGQLHYLAY